MLFFLNIIIFLWIFRNKARPNSSSSRRCTKHTFYGGTTSSKS